MDDNKAGMFIRPPSGSFTSWENTMCNPLGGMRAQTQSAWHDGYASAKVERLEWQGLTDEDIYSIIESNVPPKLTSLFEIAEWVAKVVEARLKEKNGG